MTLNQLPPEPPVSLEDTQPRPILLPPDDGEFDQPGCASRLLVAMVLTILLGMGLTTVALAGVAGYRDGGVARQTARAVAMVNTAVVQATLGWRDLNAGQYELAFTRCDYARTLQPFNPTLQPGVLACRSTAQAAMLATATPTLMPTTAVLPTQTPNPTMAVTSTTGFSNEDLFARSQDAMRRNDYEDVARWLEALRAQDFTFRRVEVEEMLINAYLTLAGNFRYEARYSEMVIVVRKAQKIRATLPENWGFTADMAQLYMSARNYLETQNYALAAQVFRTLMTSAPTFSSDTKTLACKAFQLAGDTGALNQYCQ